MPPDVPSGPAGGVRDALIGANSGVYLLWKGLAVSERGTQFFLRHFAGSYENLRRHRWHSFFLSGFSHMTLGHLFVNCFGLYVLLGPDCLGQWLSSREVLGAYLLASGAGAILQAIYTGNRVIGASAAVMAFFAVESLVEPMKRFILLFPIPGLTVTSLQLAEGLWVTNVLLFLANHLRGKRSHVAWLGHVVGMAVGAIAGYWNYATGDDRFQEGVPALKRSFHTWGQRTAGQSGPLVEAPCFFRCA